ncbi:MAG: biotin transporter BioY [Oscillospiraceae bacterium]|nr:biotin transporter BioY [Oscillospiraceae bacterium]
MKNRNPLKFLLLSAVFAALTAMGAFLRIPVGHSSFSLQFFFTCMAGLLLGPYWGAASQLIYVLLGLLGLPVFTEGGGLMYVFKPTFGFLLGLIPAAFVIGLLGRKKRLPALLLGLAVLYTVGLPYLHFALDGAFRPWQTLLYGCLIFLPFDFLKLLGAGYLSRRLEKHL